MEGSCRIRVRYGETDCMGYLHHSCYVAYFECGRVELMRDLGFSYARMEREDRCFLPVREVEVVYHAPAFFDDELEVVTRVADYSYVRLAFRYEVRRPKDGVVCAEGRTVLAAVDEKGQLRKLPTDLHEYLESLPLPPEAERRRRNRRVTRDVQ